MAVTKLIRVGGKLGVLGIGCSPDGVVRDTTRWHVMNPGSYNAPQLGGTDNAGLTVGRTICGMFAYSNGYAADWRPPEGSLCPACQERM